MENKIWNVDNFKMELKRQGLFSETLEDFIDNYMRFDNEEPQWLEKLIDVTGELETELM